MASTVYGGGQPAGPGRITLQAPGIFRMEVGEITGRRTPRLESVVSTLTNAKIPATISEDIQVSLWTKFAAICTASSVGAVTRAPMGVYRSLPSTRAMCEDMLEECLAVASARNIGLPDTYVADVMRGLDSLPPTYTVSMQRDIMEGRPSELEYQVGTLVRFGQEAGVLTPVASFMYAALLPQEMKARGQL